MTSSSFAISTRFIVTCGSRFCSAESEASARRRSQERTASAEAPRLVRGGPQVAELVRDVRRVRGPQRDGALVVVEVVTALRQPQAALSEVREVRVGVLEVRLHLDAEEGTGADAVQVDASARASSIEAAASIRSRYGRSGSTPAAAIAASSIPAA